MSEFTVVDCSHAGVALQGRVAKPEGAGPFPAVLLFPGAAGPGDTFRGYARQLADRGYLAVMIDMYGVDADISTPDKAGVFFMELLDQPDRLRDRCVAWLDRVRGLPEVDATRVAALGYCFGGKCVLELARSGADLKAVVSFHGLLTTHAPARTGTVFPEIAVWSAGRDPFAPVAQLDELRAELDAAQARYQVTLFSYAEHSFTDPDHEGVMDGIAFHPVASAVAWAGTIALLDHHLAIEDARS